MPAYRFNYHQISAVSMVDEVEGQCCVCRSRVGRVRHRVYIFTWTLDSGRLILRATSSRMKISG